MTDSAKFLFYLFKTTGAVIEKGNHTPYDIDVDNPDIHDAAEVSDDGILRFDRF